MLRVTPGHLAPRALPHALALRPRVAKPSPVVAEPPPRTLAVRGHAPNGSAAALIAEPTGVCLVSADRARRRRVRRFAIREILAVEEHRTAKSTELTIVTASSTVCIRDVDIAQAWSFCRGLRELILDGTQGSRRRHPQES